MEAEKHVAVHVSPNALVIHLKRFSHSYAKISRQVWAIGFLCVFCAWVNDSIADKQDSMSASCSSQRSACDKDEQCCSQVAHAH